MRRVPAKVCCLITQQTLSRPSGNKSSCPNSDRFPPYALSLFLPLWDHNPMNAIVPAEEVVRSSQGENRGELPGSQRQDWEDKRRLLERHNAHFGPDGPRSSWPGRVFASGVRMFGLGTRLVRIHPRGRRNALDVRLVPVSLSFPDLPPAFDGYRILQLSDTHLDFLPDLSAIAARLLAGVEVDLLALTGDVRGHHRAPIAASTTPLADLLKAVRVNDPRRYG